MAGRNRFNNISSKEWLPFQKSWYVEDDIAETYRKNIRFFVKFDWDEHPPIVFFRGNPKKEKLFKSIAAEEGAQVLTEVNSIAEETSIQFALIDVVDEAIALQNKDEVTQLNTTIFKLAEQLQPHLIHRRFLSVFTKNCFLNETYLPKAWDLSQRMAEIYTLKDEKIACLSVEENDPSNTYFSTAANVYYALYFRNDENSGVDYGQFHETDFFVKNTQEFGVVKSKNKISNWHIIKPPRRNKKEVLHPAKFPEEVVELFLPIFTKKHDAVFDPMSGTASTQLAALQNERNAYGTELSPFFFEIAQERLKNYLNPEQQAIFDEIPKHVDFKLIQKDARNVKTSDFPEIDYIFTSPPYWDMLNMAGAENQAKRIKKGLPTNYSNSELDLGNIADYRLFIENLVEIYQQLIKLLKPGGYFTIVVKNIKKKGKNYPFAYDLGHLLQKDLILLPEVFWLQDDINLAPYGYGNTFVSNTFHQYCLTFQKPKN